MQATRKKLKLKPFWEYAPLVACALLFFIVDLTLPLGVAGAVPYIIIVLAAVWSFKKEWIVITSIICSLLTLIGFLYSPPGSELWKAVTNRALVLFTILIIAIVGLQRKKMEQKRDDALLEKEKALDDLKILKGLLPICASCKQIRDDKGHWTQLEHYIHEHSEAEFSHGLCPECARKLYPDLYTHEPDNTKG
jgi:hypothetical protein